MGTPLRLDAARPAELGFPLRVLPPAPNAAYARKSTESADRQSKSHEQQLEKIATICPEPIPDDLVWRDSKSGTSFETRDGFMSMFAFCERHPQPKKKPGLIWMYDESRFGRPLDEDGETDTDQWFEWALRFKRLGWHLRFCETPEMNDAMSNDMVRTMKAHMGSQFSRDLSRKVKRGRNNWLKQGYWVGKPPWPAMRYDATRNRLLMGTEKDRSGNVVQSAEPSVNGCLLAANPDWLTHWEWAAREIEKGHSLDDVAFRLTKERGAMTAQGNRWHRKALLDSLTNRALIGEVLWTDDKGVKQVSPAKWEPLVDVALFKSVGRKLALLKRNGKRVKSAENPTVLDNIYCAHCGAKYFGQARRNNRGVILLAESGVPLRDYRHPSVRQANLGGMDIYDRAMAHGCKKWTVPAEIAETTARDLMQNLRGSVDWAKEVERMWNSQREYKSTARFGLKQAEIALDELNDRLENLLSTAGLMKPGSAGQKKLASQIEEISEAIVVAEAEVEDARAKMSAASVAFGYVKELIDETRQIAATWDSTDVLAKRRIVDRWISSVWVVVDQPPGARHARSRALHYFLRVSPNDPKVVELPNHQGKYERAGKASVAASGAPKAVFEKGDLQLLVGRTFAKPLLATPAQRRIPGPRDVPARSLLPALASLRAKRSGTPILLSRLNHITLKMTNAQGMR